MTIEDKISKLTVMHMYSHDLSFNNLSMSSQFNYFNEETIEGLVTAQS